MNIHNFMFKMVLENDCVAMPLHLARDRMELLDGYECVKYCVFRPLDALHS